ncbi:MAG: SMC-Scp complex subunit ScpB [Spirochaetes bacterium]|nr:SMC-Scp complex subunit ScpB [Spirochaetota bacterium]
MLDKESALVEAILFLEAEPMDLKSICRISGLSREVVLSVMEKIRNQYAKDEHGIELIELGGGYLFSPKKEFWDVLKERYGKKQEGKLSRAALETLAIIAYSQPITKTEIENLRGVSADSMIKLLLSKGLIREVGKKDAPGKPVQYGTTKEFLKMFGLKSIAELPKLDEYEKERFELNG